MNDFAVRVEIGDSERPIRIKASLKKPLSLQRADNFDERAWEKAVITPMIANILSLTLLTNHVATLLNQLESFSTQPTLFRTVVNQNILISNDRHLCFENEISVRIAFALVLLTDKRRPRIKLHQITDSELFITLVVNVILSFALLADHSSTLISRSA